MIKSNIDYRSDIDGLRAIAVILVILFHSGFTGFSGGFIGVDIFFVISGYLITTIILRKLDKSKFDIKEFYIRRIKRIFPSLFIVKFFVLIIVSCIYDPITFEALGKSLISSSLFVSNVYFWKTSGYFDSNIYMKPLIHTWSLSLEEQFYLFFPIFLILIYKYYKSKLKIFILIIILISFSMSSFGVVYYPSATYYLPITRGWELLIGSILSLKILPIIQNRFKKNIIFLISISLIYLSAYLLTEASIFPGYNAIFPVIGASLIIHNGKNNNSSLQDVLKNRYFVFIGKISYPLYLWNWPIISFYKYIKTTPWTYFDSISSLFFSFILAYLTWVLVENPIKRNHFEKNKRKYIFIISFSVIVSTMILGLMIVLTRGMPNRVNTEISEIVNEVSKDEFWDVQNDWEINNLNHYFKVTPPVVGKQGLDPTYALIGDSHARALVAAFANLSNIHKSTGYMITMSGTPPLIGTALLSSVNDNGFNENEYNSSILKFLKENTNIKTIILAARWGVYINGRWKEKREDPGYSIFYDKNQNEIQNKKALELGLASFIDSVIILNKKIIILTDVPEIGYDVPSFFWCSSILPSLINFESIRPTIKEYYQREKKANEILEIISNKNGLKLIHIENVMYDKNNIAIVKNKNNLLYRDNNHLSKNGSLFLTPILNQIFVNMGN